MQSVTLVWPEYMLTMSPLKKVLQVSSEAKAQCYRGTDLAISYTMCICPAPTLLASLDCALQLLASLFILPVTCIAHDQQEVEYHKRQVYSHTDPDYCFQYSPCQQPFIAG